MHIVSDDDHWTRTRAVGIVQPVSTAESTTERQCLLLTASNSCHFMTCTYPIQPSLVSAGFPKK